MNGAEQVQAARDCLSRARTAEEQLRSALYEATVWLTLAATPASDDSDERGGEG